VRAHKKNCGGGRAGVVILGYISNAGWEGTRGGRRGGVPTLHAGAFGFSLFSHVMYIKLGAKITINLGGSGEQLEEGVIVKFWERRSLHLVCIKKG
jgi:hypothetical protein